MNKLAVASQGYILYLHAKYPYANHMAMRIFLEQVERTGLDYRGAVIKLERDMKRYSWDQDTTDALETAIRYLAPKTFSDSKLEDFFQ